MFLFRFFFCVWPWIVLFNLTFNSLKLTNCEIEFLQFLCNRRYYILTQRRTLKLFFPHKKIWPVRQEIWSCVYIFLNLFVIHECIFTRDCLTSLCMISCLALHTFANYSCDWALFGVFKETSTDLNIGKSISIN